MRVDRGNHRRRKVLEKIRNDRLLFTSTGLGLRKQQGSFFPLVNRKEGRKGENR